jgi:hypothetical protein
MRKIVTPQQTSLFDSYDPVLNERARKRLLDDWPGMFRHVTLELMPVTELGSHLHDTMGRPSKELYSMAGLILLMEMMNWTKQEAVTEYCFNMAVHYALNLEPVAQDLSVRTLERYILKYEQEELAAKVMHDVSTKLVELLGIEIDQQRLDSTHVFSNMADFGRTRLMGVAIRRFLAKVKQYDTEGFELLEETLRQRYAPSVHHLFGDTGKDKESRRLLRQQVAEDMLALVQRFADDPAHNNRDTYKAMKRIFYEQCEVQEDKVTVKAKPGGDIMQNPSDPDATRDGHKGAGYQVQISETCNPDNEVQLITSALPQTAVESDSEALEPVLEDLKESNLLPEQMLADTSYCSDENVEKAANAYGVELVGPVPSGSVTDEKAYSLNVDDFSIDEKTEEVICCPAGHKPTSSVHDPETGRTHTIMPESACCGCDYGAECPVKKSRGGYTFCHTAKARRTAGRRREEATDVFRERYQRRSGIEGTNSGLKRRTGAGQLRVRGAPRVFQAIYLKITGWNILRASVCAKMREIVYQRANMAVWRSYVMRFLAIFGGNTYIRGPVQPLKRFHGDFTGCVRLPAVA